MNKKKSRNEKVKSTVLNKEEPVVVSCEADSQPMQIENNHFDVVHPKEEFELIQSQFNIGVSDKLFVNKYFYCIIETNVCTGAIKRTSKLFSQFV